MFEGSSPNVRKQILGLLTNRWAIGTFIALTLQQLIEASSTIWLVKLMSSLTAGEEFLIFLILYLITLALPYIPWCIAFILKITWRQEAQRSFIDAFVANNRNNITEWSNKGIKEEKLSILTSEGPNALNLLIDYCFDLCTYSLSVIFNIATLSIAVEPLFAVSYGISVTFVIIIMKMNRRAQRFLTQKALTARIELGQSLLEAWDNVLLGNRYNFELWKDKTGQRVNRCLQRNVDLERFDQLMAIFVSLMTCIPTLVVVVYYFLKHSTDIVKLSSFVVALPLLFMVLSYTYQTLTLAFRWSMHRSKLLSIYRSIQASKDNPKILEKKIKWAKIFFSNTFPAQTEADDNHVSLKGPMPMNSQADILSKAAQSGRITIRGENGSGKSTLLILIKSALEERAFFFPTHNQLSFVSETNKYSTGESLKKRLVEISEKVDVDVLLLDEWDANLDKENQEKLSSLIDELAAKKCVIEVRHR